MLLSSLTFIRHLLFFILMVCCQLFDVLFVLLDKVIFLVFMILVQIIDFLTVRFEHFVVLVEDETVLLDTFAIAALQVFLLAQN